MYRNKLLLIFNTEVLIACPFYLSLSCLMPSLKQIKNRIKSTQNLKKITKALEVVSTVKLQKNKSFTENMRDYFIKLTQLIGNISDYSELFVESINPAATRDLVIVMSSDKWLCGATNSKLFKNITSEYADSKATTDIFAVGKKWLEFAVRAWYTVVGELMLWDKFVQGDLKILFAFLDLHAQDYRTITIEFNYFKNTLIQIPQTLTIFPLDQSQVAKLLHKADLDPNLRARTMSDETLVEPDIETLNTELRRQIKQYVIMSALLQNKLTEHANRMIAMKSAKENCSKVIEWLTLQYNKARQAAITKEISEIVSAKIAIEW